jgi:hypothetical protein
MKLKKTPRLRGTIESECLKASLFIDGSLNFQLSGANDMKIIDAMHAKQ